MWFDLVLYETGQGALDELLQIHTVISAVVWDTVNLLQVMDIAEDLGGPEGMHGMFYLVFKVCRRGWWRRTKCALTSHELKRNEK